MSALRTLVFRTDNPCNSVVYDEATNEDVYTVRTEHTKDTTTYLEDASGDVIASWKWRDVRSDIITFGSAQPIPASAWLQKSMIPFVDTMTFKSPDGATYKWKGTSPGSRIELYAANDSKNPIATFRKSIVTQDRTVDPPVPNYTPAKLLLDARGQEIQNLVLISFLLIEKRRREDDASATNMADSFAASAKVGVGAT